MSPINRLAQSNSARAFSSADATDTRKPVVATFKREPQAAATVKAHGKDRYTNWSTLPAPAAVSAQRMAQIFSQPGDYFFPYPMGSLGWNNQAAAQGVGVQNNENGVVDIFAIGAQAGPHNPSEICRVRSFGQGNLQVSGHGDRLIVIQNGVIIEEDSHYLPPDLDRFLEKAQSALPL